MKLMTEINEGIDLITEASENGEKSYFIEGICMQSEIKNRNGRMYPREILSNEVDRYVKEYIDRTRAFGELGHPAGPTINLDRVSHMFTELKEEGSNFVCRAKILDTPMGKVVKNFMDEGVTLGVSSRGMGSLRENRQGIQEVQADFMLATPGDIVHDPSAPSAFVNGIMENVEWIYSPAAHSWKAQERVERIVEATKKLSKRQLEENALAIFDKYLSSITK